MADETIEVKLAALQTKIIGLLNLLDPEARALAEEKFVIDTGILAEKVSDFIRGSEDWAGFWPALGPAEYPALLRVYEEIKSDMEEMQLVPIAIPDQNPLFRFGLSGDRLALLPPEAEGSDFEAMAALRDEMLTALDELRAIYAKKPNRPQVELIEPAVDRYFDEMSKILEAINPVTLYARGSRLIAAGRRAGAMIDRGDWPENEPGESAALDTLADLHGAFLMQTAAGRKIVIDARDFENTPEQDAEEGRLIAEIGRIVTSEPGLLDDSSAETVAELTRDSDDDAQPQHRRYVKIAFTYSLLTAIVGTELVVTTGAAVSGNVILAGLGGVATLLTTESIKRTPSFRDDTQLIAEANEEVIGALTLKVSSVISRARPTLIALSEKRELFKWIKSGLSQSKLGQFISSSSSYRLTVVIDSRNTKGLSIIGDLYLGVESGRGYTFPIAEDSPLDLARFLAKILNGTSSHEVDSLKNSERHKISVIFAGPDDGGDKYSIMGFAATGANLIHGVMKIILHDSDGLVLSEVFIEDSAL